jgi:hypothetical protein
MAPPLEFLAAPHSSHVQTYCAPPHLLRSLVLVICQRLLMVSSFDWDQNKREGAERERRLRRWADDVESGRIRLRNSYLFFYFSVL